MTTKSAKLRRGEEGQISVFVVLGLIPVIFLFALVLNTTKQTTHKIQLQGAADSGGTSGAVWMARGMNLTVLNNNGMAEVISVMIVVRALHYTVVGMNKITIPPLLPFAEIPAVAAYIFFLETLESALTAVDQALSNVAAGIGWTIMRALDVLNQVIKTVIPGIVQVESMKYARENGANEPSFIISGARGIDISDLLPMMPVGRGLTRFTVERAESCQLPKIVRVGDIAIAAVYPLDFLLALASFNGLVRQNTASLKSSAVNIPFPPPLRWPSNPPRPMILTDNPSRAAAARTNIPEENVDLRRVRRFLQLLMVAFDERTRRSPIGGERFPNETPPWLGGVQFTYAQADIYNPTYWNMFTQDWRAKLEKASLIEEKKDALGKKFGIGRLSQFVDLSFVNTH